MQTKTLREQVRLLLDIIEDDEMSRYYALAFLSDGEALARWGITDQDAVEIVYSWVSKDDDDDFYHQRTSADQEANR